MITITEKKNCCGCFSCVNTCPRDCISMRPDDDGFLYPVVDTNKCVRCGLCCAACPMLTYRVPKRKPAAFGAINKDEAVRSQSSSGGVFFLLCEYVIERGGAVFGAEFDGSFRVKHGCSQTLEGCKRFMGSKYSQSSIGGAYRDAKQLLEQGREVLFSGTPCQIAGLYAFLGDKKDYENLITQDIVCHSVPAPKKWEEFKRDISGGRQISEISFRNKDTGWNSGSFVAKFDDGSEYRELYAQTSYMKGFLSGEYSRPSCLSCPFSRLERQSDITLGDFWGVEGLYPKLYDNKGTSLVLISSPKGKKIYKLIAKNLIQKKVKTEWAVKYNPAACKREQLFTSPVRDSEERI